MKKKWKFLMVMAVLTVTCILSGGMAAMAADASDDSEDAATAASSISLKSSTVIKDKNLRRELKTYDKNGDGSLSASEIKSITSLTASGTITDFSGIEKLTSLTSLEIYSSKVKTLKLKSNSKLESISLSYCDDLTSLKMGKMKKLSSLNVVGCNKLTSLNMNSYKTLTSISLSRCSSLKTLNVKKLSKLTSISVYECDALESLDVSGLKALGSIYCNCCDKLTSLNASKCTSLTLLRCTANSKLSSLNLKGDKKLSDISAFENALTSVDLTTNVNLTWLDVRGNKLESIDLSKNKKLYWINVADNKLTKIDVSAQGKSLATLYCYNNKLTKLNLTKNSGLSRFNASDNELTALNLKKNTSVNVEDNSTGVYTYEMDMLENQSYIATVTEQKNGYLVSLPAGVSTSRITSYPSKAKLTSAGFLFKTAASVPSTFTYEYKTGLVSDGSAYNMKVNVVIKMKTPTVTVQGTSDYTSSGSRYSAMLVSWNRVPGAEGYIVYKKASNGTWKKLRTISTRNVLNCVDSKVTSGKFYRYRVVAYNSSGKTAKVSKAVRFLKAPTVSVAQKSSGIKIKWSKVKGASGYIIYRWSSNSSNGEFKAVKVVSAGTTRSYLDRKAKASGDYAYYVRAYYKKDGVKTYGAESEYMYTYIE